jgi:Bacterial membrane protein YfhO
MAPTIPRLLSGRNLSTLVIILLPLIYLYPAVLGTVTLVQGDGWTDLLGLHIALGQSIAQGVFPLWNPHIFGGMPLLAEIYTGALYPPNWLFGLLPPGVAVNIVVITTYHIALAGAYRYARAIGINRAGSIVTGVAFTFGGFIVSAMGQASTIAAVAWMPWILLATEKLYKGVSWRWISLGAIFVALQFFAGVPQITWYTVLVGGAYFLFSALIRDRQQPRGTYVFGVSVMAICGALLSAVQLLPLRELQLLGGRAKLDYGHFAEYSFPLPQVPALLFPYFYGGASRPPYHIPYWGDVGVYVTCGYVGMLALLLAIVAVAGVRRQSLLWFWVGVVILSFTLSLGSFLPFGLNKLLYQVPVYNLFRASFRHMVEFTFACAVLAGMGVNYLGQGDLKETRRAFRVGLATMVIAVVITASAYIFGLRFFETAIPRPAQGYSITNPEILVPLLFFSISAVVLWNYARRRTLRSAALLVAVLLADLASYGHFLDWRSYTFSVADRLGDPPTVKYIKTREADLNSFRVLTYTAEPFGGNYDLLNHPNISIARGLQSANGCEMLQLRAPAAVLGDISQLGVIQQPGAFSTTDQGLNLFNIKYLFTDLGVPLEAGKGRVYDGVRFRLYPLDLNLKPGDHQELGVKETTATELAILTALVDSVHIDDGTPIVKLKIHTKDGKVFERELQAGRDSSEWAFDRPDVTARIKHARARLGESWSVSDAMGSFEGHSYLARYPFDRTEIVKVEMDYLRQDATIQIRGATLFDSTIGLSVPLDTVSLPPERWRKLISFGEVDIYQNMKMMPRAWFVNKVLAIPGEEVLQTIRQGKAREGEPFDPAETALIEKEGLGPAETDLFQSIGKIDSDVAVTRYEAQRIEVRTRNQKPGFLVLSEVYFPGWVAQVDGVESPLYRVDHTLRGLMVPPGEHKISFVYTAPSLRKGAIISGIGMAILLVGACYPKLRRFKSKKSNSRYGDIDKE